MAGHAGDDAARQRRTGIDHARIELDQIGTGADLLDRAFGRIDAAGPHQRDVGTNQLAHPGEHDRRLAE